MTNHPSSRAQSDPEAGDEPDAPGAHEPDTDAGEAGGPAGLEPTRYGDWEKNGRCIDF